MVGIAKYNKILNIIFPLKQKNILQMFIPTIGESQTPIGFQARENHANI